MTFQKTVTGESYFKSLRGLSLFGYIAVDPASVMKRWRAPQDVRASQEVEKDPRVDKIPRNGHGPQSWRGEDPGRWSRTKREQDVKMWTGP